MKNTEEKIPLVMTATVNPSPKFREIYGQDLIEERKEQYRSALERYIKESPFTDIIFIENSGYNFDEECYKKLAKKFDKRIEFIAASQIDAEVDKKGRSIGDALMINEALDKSEFLKNFDYFYKITGKLYLENAEKILETRKKYRNEFLTHQHIGVCHSYFFKANIADYKKFIYPHLDEIDERKTNDIEIFFFRKLVNAPIEIGCYKEYPDMGDAQVGFRKGVLYTPKGFKKNLKNLACRTKVFTMNSTSAKLVAKVQKLMKVNSYN